MSISNEITEAITQHMLKHGNLPGHVFLPDDKWAEWESSGKPVLPGFFKGGIQVHHEPMLVAGSIMPMPHDIDSRTWRPGIPQFPEHLRTDFDSYVTTMQKLCFGMEVLR